jgi:hypothetical protein
MANIARLKTWNLNETLTSADLNAEFDNILSGTNNGSLDSDNIDQTDSYTWSGNHTFNSLVTHGANLTVGVDDTGHDVQFFGATSGAHFLWDESADTLKMVGGAKINAQGTVTVGVDDTGYDVKFFGATPGKSWLWDESADTEIVTGNSTISGTLGVTGLTTATGGITSGANIVSDTDSTDDLGTTSVRWANVYTDAIGDSGAPTALNASSMRAANIPSCLVTPVDGGIANATGDGTVYTIVYGTEIFDQGADFSSTTFTAPVTGRYQISGQVGVSNLGSSHTTAIVKIITSNRTYEQEFNPYAIQSGTIAVFPFSMIADLDASDTVTVTVQVSGGTKVVYVNNPSSTAAKTWLSIQMIA